MSLDSDAEDFVDKSKVVGLEILKTISIHTMDEPTPMDLKIALFALTKVSASVIHNMSHEAENKEELLELFVNTVLGSVKELTNIDDAKEAAEDVINKLRGMK